jgi:hypothetical protein
VRVQLLVSVVKALLHFGTPASTETLDYADGFDYERTISCDERLTLGTRDQEFGTTKFNATAHL